VCVRVVNVCVVLCNLKNVFYQAPSQDRYMYHLLNRMEVIPHLLSSLLHRPCFENSYMDLFVV
jgi:hypothetical protein